MFSTTYGFDAGQPQPYPGCEDYIGTRPWSKESGYGWCFGCGSWQELSFGRITDHEPADPQYMGCPFCKAPYPFASYTNPPCDRCATKVDIAEFLRNGGDPASIGEYWGDDGVALANEMINYSDTTE